MMYDSGQQVLLGLNEPSLTVAYHYKYYNMVYKFYFVNFFGYTCPYSIAVKYIILSLRW